MHIDSIKRERSAGVIIARDSQIGLQYLLLHYKGGHWDFSKGHLEKGEKAMDASIREVHEETGISSDELEFVNGFREVVRYSFKAYTNAKSERITFPGDAIGVEGGKKKMTLVNKTVVFFLACTNKKIVRLLSKDEHIGYEWFSYQEAIDTITFQQSKKILTIANLKLQYDRKQSIKQ